MRLLYLLTCIVTLCHTNPLLVVVLMVKNEEQVICKTLDPFVKAGLKDFFIFDTGSEDNTVEVTKSYFRKHGIENGFIGQEEFVDFATSRNRALDLALEKFPNAIFMLMPDAEWFMHNVEALVEFCSQEKFNNTTSYLVRIMNTVQDFYTPRLIRCHCNIRFAGVVHEVLMPASMAKVPPEVYFELTQSRYGYEKSKKRWKRDKELLLKEHKKNRYDSRTAFYLAQTYEGLGELEKAYNCYVHRCALVGWPEEDFIALYRLAQLIERLSQDKTKKNYPWALAKQYYLKAFAMRPHRAEPLIKLAQHYWNVGDYVSCYGIAKQACTIPYPTHDVLFVEKYAYDFVRWDLLGRGAYYINEWETGVQATLKAIQTNPNVAYLHYNILCFLNQKRSNYHLRTL